MQGFFDEIALDFVRAGDHGAVLPALANVAERRDAVGRPCSIRMAVFRAPHRRRYERELLQARRASERANAELRASEARLRALQVELLHVSRVSAAGEMASALAHELNQPLTATASAVKAVQRMLAWSPPAAPTEIREAIDLAAEQALRAGQIVRRLRNFVARGGNDGEAEKRPEDLARLVEDAGALALAGATERGVHIAVRLCAGLPRVLADRVQIQQVLVNLMRNALEAMASVGEVREGGGVDHWPPHGRELTVTGAPVDACPPELVEVAVADTGPGLAPEIAGRLFDPFVSTKPGGMGMGLAICRTIIEAHGGRLWAEPNRASGGRGAVFRFTLPTVQPEPVRSGPEPGTWA